MLKSKAAEAPVESTDCSVSELDRAYSRDARWCLIVAAAATALVYLAGFEVVARHFF